MLRLQPEHNPLLNAGTGRPKFAEIHPTHVVPAMRALIAEATQRLHALEQQVGRLHNPTWESVMAPIAAIDRALGQVWNVVSHLHTSQQQAFHEVYEQGQQMLVDFNLRLAQSKPLYKAVRRIRDGAGWDALPAWQQRVVTQYVQGAEQSGLALKGRPLARFNAIVKQLSTLSTQFQKNVSDAMEAWHYETRDPAELAGLTPEFLAKAADNYNKAHPGQPAATPENGPWRLRFNGSISQQVMKAAQNRELRKRYYDARRAFGVDAPYDNRPLAQEILQLRLEQARLLGFPDYAALNLSTKMAGNVDNVLALTDQMLKAALKAKGPQLQLLREQAAADGVHELQPWDALFYEERLREAHYAVSDKITRKYFTFDHALEGLFKITRELFGVRLVEATGKASVDHPDVRFYEVQDAAGTVIAGIYMDPFARDDKKDHAWMENVRARHRNADGSLQLPLAFLNTNFEKIDGEPVRLSFDEVSTLFHEFGHCLQHMLATPDFDGVADIDSIEWDAVEVASQFLENWLYQKSTLLPMTAHETTGAPMPDKLFDQIVANRKFLNAPLLLGQLRLALSDLALHHGYDASGDVTMAQAVLPILQATSFLPFDPASEPARFLFSFNHVFAGGYAAGYYTYLWSDVMAADIFSAFLPHLDNPEKVRELGRLLRDTLYGMGGSAPAAEVFRAFLGRDPSPAALLAQYGVA